MENFKLGSPKPNNNCLVGKNVCNPEVWHFQKDVGVTGCFTDSLHKAPFCHACTEYLDRRLHGLDFKARNVRRDLPAVNGLQMWVVLLQARGKG